VSDDEREAYQEHVERLTALAQRAFVLVDDGIVAEDIGVDLYEGSTGDFNDAQVTVRGSVWVSIENHPRAFKALEAALAVLAGEAPQPHWVDELWGRWTAWAMQHESLQARRDPETESLHEGAVLAYRRCASELRKRAKEETCE